MLEILVSCRHRGETEQKKAGDILVAKIAPAQWGDEERRVHLITLLDDAELENAMRARNQKSRSLPYAVYGDRHLETGYREMLCRSGLRVPMELFVGTIGTDPAVCCRQPTPPLGKTHLTRADLIEVNDG